MIRLLISLVIISLLGCGEGIVAGDNVENKDLEHLKSLGLLGENETVVRFFSQNDKARNGSFYTDKRIAGYWIDKDRPEKSELRSAFYQEIISIDTVYYAGLTWLPYMRVKKSDSTAFKVYLGGEKQEIRAFYEDAMRLWESEKKKN